MAVNLPDLHRLLVLLEICALNAISMDNNDALGKLALSLQDRLLQHNKAGGEVLLADDAQRSLWFDLLAQHGLAGRKSRGKASR